VPSGKNTWSINIPRNMFHALPIRMAKRKVIISQDCLKQSAEKLGIFPSFPHWIVANSPACLGLLAIACRIPFKYSARKQVKVN
jgi:hypothetical protein